MQEGRALHCKYALQLLRCARELLAREATMQEAGIAEGSRMTVVGDIHGQLQDLYSIFTINGLPGADNAYLFNGDFVDRGPKGCEVFFSLCAFKVKRLQWAQLTGPAAGTLATLSPC